MAATAALKAKPQTRRDATRDRRSVRTRTIPEQIADHVAIAIIKGEFRDGEHLPEQKIAALFDVSHGPVREAIRTLSKRGLVEFRPRRGAFVIGVTIDAIADIFNIRAVLLGLAAHSLAKLPVKQRPMAELNERIAHIRTLAADASVDPETFAQALGRIGRTIFDGCGNAHLTRILREEAAGSLWGYLWREHTLDFLTQKRRTHGRRRLGRAWSRRSPPATASAPRRSPARRCSIRAMRRSTRCSSCAARPCRRRGLCGSRP